MLKKIKETYSYWQKKKNMPTPQMTTPFNEEIKNQQNRFIITFLIMLLISGFYTYFYLQNKIEKEKLITVYIAKKDLEYPHILEPSDFLTQSFQKNKLPFGFYEKIKKEKNKLIGQTLVRNIISKEIFLPHHVQPDLNPESVSSKFNEAFALAMDEDWFLSKFSDIKRNDLIDIIVSNPDDNLDATVTIVSQMKVVDLQIEKTKKTLVINATEEEARAILFSRGLRLPMQILVRSGISKNN